MNRRHRILASILFFLLACSLAVQVHATASSCEEVARDFNLSLSPAIDEQELVDIVRTLDKTKNRRLPSKFITKREARSQGWRPGEDLWSVSTLRRMSIGGDRFHNAERQLPDKTWREADLDYKGGHRGGKRIIFSQDGQRFVTVDHYRTFVEVPPCR